MKRNNSVLMRIIKISLWAFFLCVAFNAIAADRSMMAKGLLCATLGIAAFTGDCILDCYQPRKRKSHVQRNNKRAA